MKFCFNVGLNNLSLVLAEGGMSVLEGYPEVDGGAGTITGRRFGVHAARQAQRGRGSEGGQQAAAFAVDRFVRDFGGGDLQCVAQRHVRIPSVGWGADRRRGNGVGLMTIEGPMRQKLRAQP